MNDTGFWTTIAEVTKELCEIHKLLLKSEGDRMELTLQRHLTPFELWKLAVEHEAFAWTRKLSATIILLEEIVDERQTFDPELGKNLANELRALLTGDPPGHEEFYRKFSAAAEEYPGIHSYRGSVLRKMSGLKDKE